MARRAKTKISYLRASFVWALVMKKGYNNLNIDVSMEKNSVEIRVDI